MFFGGGKKLLRSSVFTICCLASIIAHADYYKYTDDNGTICITDNSDSIPSKYQEKATLVKEEVPQLRSIESAHPSFPVSSVSKPLTSDKPSESKPAQSTSESKAKLHLNEIWQKVWVKIIVYIAAIVVAFFIMTKIASLLPSSQLTRIVYIAFFLGVFVFAYKLYAEYMVNSYFVIKTKAINMFKSANKRESTVINETSGVPEPQQ